MSSGAGDWPPNQPFSRLAIAQAIPAGSKRARNQRKWLRAVLADPEIARLRADHRRTVLELARVLARHANWHTMTAWHPREQACAEIGSSRDPSKPLSVSAYKRARQVLQERGLLGLVAQGWTSALRAGVLDDLTATSAVFVLAIPRCKQRFRREGESARVNGPLTGFRRKPGKALRARKAQPEVKGKTPKVTGEKAPASRGQPVLPRDSAPALGAVPQNRTEALTAARAMQERARVLGRLSAEHLRHLSRPFFAAGWSPRDVLYAIDHEPGGRQHGYTARVHSPAGWMRSRLAAWLSPGGIPRPSRSQQLTEKRRQLLAEQTARRARDTAARAQAADYKASATQAREMLLRRPRPQAPARSRAAGIPVGW